MSVMPEKKCFIFSGLLHVIVLIAFVMSFEFQSPLPVLENSNQINPVIQATVMETPVNPILPTPIEPAPPKPFTAPPQPEVIKKPIKTALAKPIAPVIVPQKQAIAIPNKKIIKKEKEIVKKEIAKKEEAEKEIAKKEITKKENNKKSIEVQSAFEKEIKALKEKSLAQQILQEKQQLANARTQKTQGEVNKYKALILQSISQRWLVPGHFDKNLSAELFIRLAPGGAVLDVQLTKSSGNSALDRSALAAVFKASPLPVPADQESFQAFRQFVLRVKPENLLTQGI